MIKQKIVKIISNSSVEIVENQLVSQFIQKETLCQKQIDYFALQYVSCFVLTQQQISKQKQSNLKRNYKIFDKKEHILWSYE